MEAQNPKRLAILLHSDPDLDCIGSAWLGQEIFKRQRDYSEIKIIGKLNYNYSWIIREEEIEEDIGDWLPMTYDCLVVDTGSPKRLLSKHREIFKKSRKAFICDHHLPKVEEWWEAWGKSEGLVFMGEARFDSCCEALLNMVSDKGKELSIRSLGLAFAGIYAESNCLRDCTGETFKVLGELMQLIGDQIPNIVRNCHKTIATWPKLEYLAKVILRKRKYEEPGVIALNSWYSEYLQHNFNISRFKRVRKPPIYILSMLRREGIKFKPNMNAYVLFFDKQDDSKKRITIIIELVRWSKERQEALRELGFETFKERQYRYYKDVPEDGCDDIASKITKALILTNSKDLEFI